MKRALKVRNVLSSGWATACGAALMTLGCQSSPPPPPANAMPIKPMVLSMSDYRSLKMKYLAANPGARFGMVNEVVPSDKRLAISDIDVSDFTTGDILAICDAQRNPIAEATVLSTTNGMLFAKYDPATVGSNRAPVRGDLAIRPASQGATAPSN